MSFLEKQSSVSGDRIISQIRLGIFLIEYHHCLSSRFSNISGLQNIADDLYEAGAIDGIRSRWQELRFITLPQMKNMLLFSAVMQIQSSFSVSSIAIELAGFPSTQYAVDTIVSHMTDMATVRFEYGYASAIAVILFIMMAGTRGLIGKVLSLIGK